jgi:hypothetical protein
MTAAVIPEWVAHLTIVGMLTAGLVGIVRDLLLGDR